MSASRYIGRVGGLAVGLGVGAAVFSCMGVASADTGSQDATGASSVSVRRGPAADNGVRPANHRSAAAETASAPGSAARTLSASALNASALNASALDSDIPQRHSSALSRRATGSVARLPAASSADPVGAAAASLPATPRAVAAAVTALSSVPNPDALAPHFSLKVVGITALSTTASLAGALLNQLSIAIHIGPTKSPFNQTVTVNGYNLVPASTELLTSFYGPWTYAPGGLNMRQGQQQYDVVDPTTQATLGTVDTLVSSGTPLGLGTYTELIVTSTNGIVGAGDIPPYGSVFANMRLIAGFGWAYSSVPSPSGNVVSFALTTPFGDIPIPFVQWDAGLGIADHSVDNRPIDLGNGYSIAPSDPAGETLTGTTGILPIFQTVQAREQFDIRDSSGTTVGTFEGVVCPTWDIFGAYTQAILVTQSNGDNVGTAPGQVPPPGTVYNVSYAGSDTEYALYTSMPSPSGNVISMIESSNGKVSNVLTWPVNRLDASAPPAVKRLPFAGGYGILPTSDLTPIGVNGLPPRDVQVQGYQQFAVYDKTGVQSGSFNAIVANQWDLLGIYSQAILVTEVTDGTAGTAVGDVPPVGSILNYVYFGDTGFGSSYWSLPSSSGTKTSYKILLPIFSIPTWSSYNASAGIDSVTLVNPLDV